MPNRLGGSRGLSNVAIHSSARGLLHAVLALVLALVITGVAGCSGSQPKGSNGGAAGQAGDSAATPGASGVGAAGQVSQAGGKGGALSGQAGDTRGMQSNAGRGAGTGGAAGASGRGASGDAGTLNDAGTHDGGSGSDAGVASGKPYLYVSGYGGDITRFSLNPDTFAATKLGTASGGTSPSYLAISPDKRFLYAINEASSPNSKVVAFTIDPSDGHLTKINDAQTGGSGAPHLAVHPSGKWIAVAHYTSGQISILPVHDDGSVGDATVVNKGPSDGCGKAHQALFDSTGNYLFVPCLDSNYVIQFKFSQGMLSYNTPATVAVNGGPRHLALDPSEHYAFVVSELESLLTSFKYDSATGTLSDAQSVNSYDQTKGASAQIVVHPTGHWLYVSNRTENSIGLFSIDAGGRPHSVAFMKDMIATPRDFSVDSSGAFLISANQDGAQNVLIFAIDSTNGMLTRTQVVPVGGQPTFTKVLLLP